MFEFHDIQQNTDEWLALRAGKLTSSKLGVIMANYGKAFGEPAKKYAVDIAIEQITGQPVGGSYQNEHMERGHEQEPIARMLYESETFCTVDNGGFFGSDTVGCSPDGLVGSDGEIEIKCVIPSVHYANIKRQAFDPAYKWQCIGNLKFTGRDWIDFISYCEGFPQGRQLFVHRGRVSEFEEEFKMIDSRVDQFMELISETKSRIIDSSYFNQ
jgi:hypothetical protein